MRTPPSYIWYLFIVCIYIFDGRLLPKTRFKGVAHSHVATLSERIYRTWRKRRCILIFFLYANHKYALRLDLNFSQIIFLSFCDEIFLKMKIRWDKRKKNSKCRKVAGRFFGIYIVKDAHLFRISIFWNLLHEYLEKLPIIHVREVYVVY